MHRVFLLLSFFCSATAARSQSAEPPAGNDEVRKVMETFAGRGVLSDGSKPTPPKEALKSFTLRDGLTIDLIASEPDVAQPLNMTFDSRGRLWVTQYLQYQFPAGLKIMSYDQHLRAVYDKVPKPPPLGMKGADKITVFEDKDGDGIYETHKDVITGLNIATSAIKGAGGIWVMNAPYLLFYPDANDDDIPDGDPEVALSGFGLEDTHSVANSLQFGPDGWLYGSNGSTTKGNVSSKVTKNVKFQGQHIWRYHPKTTVFEVYAEGGGNTFSNEIDAQGRVFSGTNGASRGMHYEQGMNGEKSFGKHGPPDNPYGFGYFGHMLTKSDGKRFSQAFCIYDGALMSETLGGRIVAANAMQNMVYVSQRVPDSSTFQAVDEDPLLRSSDRWFRPVDIKVGPDGAIWLADWYDTRLSHVRPVDDWSKTDGRIYRVRPTTASMKREPFDLHKADVKTLIAHLANPNKWFRKQAALELEWRDEKAALPELETLVRSLKDGRALDVLFAVQELGGLNDDLAVDLLQHADPYVRRWVVRSLGDRGSVSTLLISSLRALAQKELHPEVRTQLLASAKRLPADAALPIVRAMMERDADADDKRIPLMLWWALESKAETDRAALLALFAEPAVWDFKLARDFGVHHLAQRWAAAGGAENFEACAKLLSLAKRSEDRTLVIEGIAAAFEGGKLPELPAALAGPISEYLKSRLDSDLTLAVKTGNAEAAQKAAAIVKDKTAPLANRVALAQALADSGSSAVVASLLTVLGGSDSIPAKKALLPIAARFDDPKLAQAIISGYESRFAGEPGLRDAAHRMLASRAEWAKLMLNEVDAHRIKAADVAGDIVRQLALFKEAEIDAMVKKHWKPASAKLSNEQKIAEMNRIKAFLTKPGEVERGKNIFTQRCAVCHTLFNEGGKVGPELTGYERNNPDFWLTAILDPSIEIREGFGAYIAKLKGGQALMGILTKQDATGITLKDVAGQMHSAKADDVESMEASPISIMPEGLLTGLSEAELRDFFAYLMKP
jgi:putative heme-binding domain-containing protein